MYKRFIALLLVVVMVVAVFPVPVPAHSASLPYAADESAALQDDTVYWLLVHRQLMHHCNEEVHFALLFVLPYQSLHLLTAHPKETQPDPHWTIHNGNIIFGDSPTLRNDRYVPSIHAILQSGNLFVYCINNPIMWVDSSGKFIVAAIVAVTTGVVKYVKKATGAAKTYKAKVTTNVAAVGSAATAAVNVVQNAFRLSKNNIQHISTRHVANVFANEVKHLNSRQLTEKLANRSFFNPNWTQAQVNNAVEQGVNMLHSQGITTGTHVVTVAGEQITIAFNSSGVFKTAYGTHRLTSEFFGR